MEINTFDNMEGIDPRAVKAFRAAIDAIGKDDLEEAQRCLFSSIECLPEWWVPHSVLLDIYKATNRLDEALRENQALCRLAPDNIKPNYYNSLGARFIEHENPDEAIRAFMKAIELNSYYALPHSNLANSYLKKEEYDAALREGRRALEIDPDLPDAHYFVARAFLAKQELAPALIHFEQALSLAPVHRMWPTEQEQKEIKALTFSVRSQISLQGNCLAQAAKEAQQAIDMAPGDRQRAEYHRNLGIIYTMQQEHEKALAQSREAVRLDPNEGLYHYSLGVDLTTLKRLEEARSEYRKALECGLDREIEQQAIHNLNNIEHQMRSRKAEHDILQRAGLKSARDFIEETSLRNLTIAKGLSLTEEQGRKYIAAGAHESAGWLYTLLAYIYKNHGQISNAIRCASGACEQYRKGCSQPANLAESLIVLAESHVEVGDTNRARNECFEAIRASNPQEWQPLENIEAAERIPLIVDHLVNRVFAMPHRMAVLLLDTLGRISSKEAEPEQADLCFQGARRILERTEFFQEKAAMLVQVGRSTRIRGDYRTSKELFDLAIQVARESNHKGNLVLALAERADIERCDLEGDLEQALKWINEAILAEEDGTYWDPGLVAHFLYIRGKVLEECARRKSGTSSLQDIRSAFVDLGTSVELVEDMRTMIEMDSHKIGFLVDKLEAIHSLIPLCLELSQQFAGQGFEEKGFEYTERAKSRALLDLLELSVPREEVGPEQKGASDPSGIGPSQASVAGVKEIQALLDANEALVEYVLTDSFLAAFVITSNSFSIPIYEPTDLHSEGAAAGPKILRKDVETFLNAIGHETDEDGIPTYSGRPQMLELNTVLDLGRRLYDLLIRPVMDNVFHRDTQPPERLVIVPHGILHRLPFCALFDGMKYLAERVSIVQVPSASILRHCRVNRPQNPVRCTYLGLANPVPTPLEINGCEKVVLSTARKLGYRGDWNGNWAADSNNSVYIARREAATPSLLLEEAPQYACVDLETHGDFTMGSPLDHRFLLAGGDGEHWFTANDVFQKLRMRSELLVAAMCHSGRLEVAGGDELLGLLRAFMFAGCRSILLYPWVMVDEVAELFMKKFYDELIEIDHQQVPFIGRAKDRAVQAAQMEIIGRGRQNQGLADPGGVSIASWNHPYYWAWILYGDCQ